MKLQLKIGLILGVIISCLYHSGYSQELIPYNLTLVNAIELGLKNHRQLKIAQAQLQVSNDQVQVSKLQQLPSVALSANAVYLGDALIIDKDLTEVQTIEMPHFGNSFSVQASQILYKGGAIQKSIDVAELKNQLSELDIIRNEQEIKFLIITNYLDINKLLNQLQVVEQNRILAESLLQNITKLYEQDMVTRNELLRAELNIKNLEQSIHAMKNNHAILSNKLSYALGLPDNVLIIPTEEPDVNVTMQSQAYYIDLAHQQHPVLKWGETNVEIAEKNISIQKANWSPNISAFGGYNMQRPITTSTPIMDMYNNSWQAGINLNFSIDNLYRNKRQVNLSRSLASVARESLTFTEQSIEMEVNAAFLRYNESRQQAILMEESKKLANENYEIVKAKYLNQLVIAAEMTDAGNAKLNSELQYANAVINVWFQYYNLLKTTGSI